MCIAALYTIDRHRDSLSVSKCMTEEDAAYKTMDYYSPIIKKKSCHLQEDGWNLKHYARLG